MDKSEFVVVTICDRWDDSPYHTIVLYAGSAYISQLQNAAKLKGLICNVDEYLSNTQRALDWMKQL